MSDNKAVIFEVPKKDLELEGGGGTVVNEGNLTQQNDTAAMFEAMESDTSATPTTNSTMGLTQMPVDDLFSIFGDEKTRGSITQPHIITVEKREGGDILTPCHFLDVDDDSPISIGAGYRDPKPDVTIDKPDSGGPTMPKHGLSNIAFSLVPINDNLRITITNSAPMKYFKAHVGKIVKASSGDSFVIGDGDEILFNKEAPFSAIRFIIPGWEPPEDPQLKEAKSLASAKLAQAIEGTSSSLKSECQQLHQQLENTIKSKEKVAQSRISALQNLSTSLKICQTEDEVKRITNEAFPPPPQVSLQARFQPPPRSISCSPTPPTGSSSSGKRRENQELQQFHRKKQRVQQAEKLLEHPPAKSDRQWAKKAQAARKEIAGARQTNCHFHQHGNCAAGESCNFMHSSSPPPSALGCNIGTIRRWKPFAPRGAFAFVGLQNGGDIFVPIRSFEGISFEDIREGLDVQVFDISAAPRPGSTRTAGRVTLLN